MALKKYSTYIVIIPVCRLIDFFFIITVILSFSSPDILKDFMKPYVIEKNNQFQTVAAFECRGMEPVDYSFRVSVIQHMGQNFERCTIGHFQTLSTSITPGSPPVTQKPFILVSS